MSLLNVSTFSLHTGKPTEVKKAIQGHADEELIVKFSVSGVR